MKTLVFLKANNDVLFCRYIGITMISLSPQMLEELRNADSSCFIFYSHKIWINC
jgi:hypothetical protein